MRVVRFVTPLVLVCLAYYFSLAIMSHVGFPRDMQDSHLFPYLADKPVGEDGYYMLTVAWNLADGHGISYNSDMPTTGIQPLSVVIYAGLAWIVQFLGGDKWTFIRSVLVFGGINLLLFGHLVGTITTVFIDKQESRNLGYALGFVASVFNFALFRCFTYGLETGIYLILLATCILYTLRLSSVKLGVREAISLGALTGLTAWARIDFGIVFFVFLGISLLRHQLRFRHALIAGGSTTLVISPWFLYTFLITGSWMPSSGAAQAALFTAQNAPQRFWTMGKAVLSHLTPWIYSNAGGIFSLAAFFSFIAFLALVFRGKAARLLLISRIKQQPYLMNWLAGVCALTLIYPVFFWPTHFYQRYSAPILVPLTAIMAIAVAERIRAVSKIVRSIVLYALPACFFGWAFLSLHTGRIGNTHTVTAGFVQNYFSSVKVGAFQSGIIGYFNPNVTNLDGKVNQSALDYARDKRLHLYIDSEGIDVLVDWPGYINRSLDGDWLASNWDMCEAQVPNGASICLKRKIQSRK